MPIKTKNLFLEKYLSVIVAISPILSSYWIPGFHLMPVADILLVVGCLFFLIKNIKKIKVGVPALLFLIYVFIRQIGSYNDSSYSDFTGAIHVCLYYFFLAFILLNIKKDELTLKPILIIALFSSIFIFVQLTVYYLTGKYLTGIIPILDHMEHVKIYADSVNNGSSVITFRPRSFFSEPSMFANYVAIALSVSLPKSHQNKKMLILSIIYSVGLAVSLSSTGIILCLGLWGIFGLIQPNSKSQKTEQVSDVTWVKVRFGRIFYVVIFAILFLAVVRFTPWWTSFIDHIVNGGFMNRVGNVYKAFTLNDSFVSVLFGQGKISTNYFIPEFSYIYVYWGILGYIFVLANMHTLFRERSWENLNLLFVCIALFFIGGFMATAYSPFTFYAIYAARINCTRFKRVLK